MALEDLDVWKRSTELCIEICKYFEQSTNFVLRDQVFRSALSVPSNIAEGHERLSTREMILFLGYARGFVGELRTQIHIARAAGYIEPATANRWHRETRTLSRMLTALITHLRKKAESPTKRRQ